MAIQKTEAFVLRSQPFRTSSVIVTTFSRSFGKIKGLAKGVRREGIVRPSTFEPFTLLEIVFYEKIRSELHLISEASILETFEGLRTHLETLATAYYLAELVDRLTQPHDPHETLFELLHFAFQYLPSLPSPFMARFFEIRILDEVGLAPHLGSCLICGGTNLEKVYFSTKQGAIFCARCRQKSPEARGLSAEALKVMQSFLEKRGEGFEAPLGVSGFEPLILREVGEVVERFLAESLGEPLTTLRFLKQVQALNPQSSGSSGR